MTLKNNTNILVLDANQRSALAVTRSLSKSPVTIFTADSSIDSLAGSSRYSELYFQYPDPRTNTDEFIKRISRLVAQNNISIIFPMTELTSTLLIINQQLLKQAILPFADIDTLRQLNNKSVLLKLADNLLLPVPESITYPAKTALNKEDIKASFPLVLKPAISWVEYNKEWFRTTVKIADSYSEYIDIIKSDPSFSACEYMIQEFIEGEGQGVFALYNQGQAIAFFSHKRLREKPPWGGVSVLSESVELNDKLVKYAKTLLDEAKWHGVAMVEFKVTADGTPYLMEVNTRFWGSLQLSIDSGVNFPYLLYKICCGEDVMPIQEYKTGNRLRWLLGDLDSLYILIKSRQYTLIEKIKGILRFLRPSPLRTRFEVNRLGDLKPFLWELKQYFIDLIKR